MTADAIYRSGRRLCLGCPLSFLLSPAYDHLDDIMRNSLMDPKRLQGRGLRRRVNDLISSVKFTRSARTSGCIRRSNRLVPGTGLQLLRTAARATSHRGKLRLSGLKGTAGRAASCSTPEAHPAICDRALPWAKTPERSQARGLSFLLGSRRAGIMNDGFRPVPISHHPAPAGAAHISGSCRWRWSVAVRIRRTSVPCSAQADRGRRR
jgi:hypothetical protein